MEKIVVPEDLILIAQAEIGYVEKASNNDLDKKTKNRGSHNYTKYARDMEKLGIYSVQGQPWCACFINWCFLQACKKVYEKSQYVQKAKELLNGFSAYTPTCAQFYKNMGAWIAAGEKPKEGDQIFFCNAQGIFHTGLVYQVSSERVYTIEGNTSSAKNVVANGGCVREKSYSLSYAYIAGYGRPRYQKEEDKRSSWNRKIKMLQEALCVEYNKSLIVDGIAGKQTLAATPTLNKKIRATKSKTVKAVQTLLADRGYPCAIDGDFYLEMEQQVKVFQKEKVGISPDGELTAQKQSWRVLLKMEG